MVPRKICWIFGDEILDELAPMLNNIIQNQPEELYLTKNFEIQAFSKDNQKGYHSNNFLIRIGNSFVTALNSTKVVLPSAMVIILDNKFLKDESLAESEMPKMLHHLLYTIHEMIKQRKRQIPNAYWEDNQPKLILLRPLPRPAYSLLDPQKHKTLRRIYSQHAEKLTEKFRVTLLNADELNCSQRVLFDQFGNLSAYGVEKFWKSVSDYFRRSDRDEYYAIKNYRAPKKSVGTQTYTQQSTPNAPQKFNPAPFQMPHNKPAGDNPPYSASSVPNHPPQNQPYYYQYGVNDHCHVNNY